MSTAGLPVFDTTVQETNLWLKAVMEGLHTSHRHLWRMAASPTKERRRAEFFDHVRGEFPPGSAIDPNMAARSVFAVMQDRLDRGEVDIIDRLPAKLRERWF